MTIEITPLANGLGKRDTFTVHRLNQHGQRLVLLGHVAKLKSGAWLAIRLDGRVHERKRRKGCISVLQQDETRSWAG